MGDLGLVIAAGSTKESSPSDGQLGLFNCAEPATFFMKQNDLTHEQVYEALYEIEQVAGTGSQDENKQLHDLMAQLDPISAKYVVRIVLGKLRLGFSDMTILDALSWVVAGDKSLHEVIENAYNVCADIGFIAALVVMNKEKSKDAFIDAIQSTKIQVGIPIRPAAAERWPMVRAIVEKIGPCVAQPKLDGFRLQIHMDKRSGQTKIHFYSRNLQGHVCNVSCYKAGDRKA